MKTIAAALLALGLLAGGAQARTADTVFTGISDSAPRSMFDGINDSAPRSVFDDVRDSAPRSVFDATQDAAPRAAGDGSNQLDLTGE